MTFAKFPTISVARMSLLRSPEEVSGVHCRSHIIGRRSLTLETFRHISGAESESLFLQRSLVAVIIVTIIINLVFILDTTSKLYQAGYRSKALLGKPKLELLH